MHLSRQERDQLRQRFLNDVEVNLDKLIILVEKTLSKKYDVSIKELKNQISNLTQDENKKKEIRELFNLTLRA